MKLTIEPTAECMRVEGALCRIWTGVDDNGTPVKVWVRMLQPQTHDEERLAAFERKLERLPALQVGAIDFRFLVD